MSGSVGTKEINEIFFGSKEVSEIYKGNSLLYSSYQPISNFLFRDLDANGKLTMPSSGLFEDASEITKDSDHLLEYAFYECSNLSGNVIFSNLKTISGRSSLERAFCRTGILSLAFTKLKKITGLNACHSMCYGCSNLASVSFPELELVSGTGCFKQTFGSCSLTSINFPKLQYITGAQAFYNSFLNNSQLSSVSFPELVSINNQSSTSGADVFAFAFKNCPSLKNITFPKLTTIKGGWIFNDTFDGSGLETIEFPALTRTFFNRNSVFYRMLHNVTGCTVHFPSNLESVISSWSDVTSGFGGFSTTVLFDLPSTE